MAFEQDVVGHRPLAGPRPVPPRLDGRFDAALVIDILALLGAARSPADVAAAAASVLLELPDVRAVALVAGEGAEAVVVDSAGYSCGSMAAGAVLPLDAGLPVTQAIRTGRTVVQGNGPSWVAAPYGRGRRARAAAGALLLSLDGAPPRAAEDLARLRRVARGLGDALQRAGEHERDRRDLAQVTASLGPPVRVVGGWDVTTRSISHDGEVGGDALLCLPDGRGGQWLIATDVCGSGVAAAVVARSVEATCTALAPYAEGPAALLAGADRVLRPLVSAGRFVTALAVHVVGGRLTVASAGHPEPVLLTAGGARSVVLEPGLPLALEVDCAAAWEAASVPLPDGAVVMLHTDGLVDRRGPTGACTADIRRLVCGLPLDDLEALADAVLAGAELVGRAGDDASVMLARPPV